MHTSHGSVRGRVIQDRFSSRVVFFRVGLGVVYYYSG